MKYEKLSPSKRAVEKRNSKIRALYNGMVASIPLKEKLYIAIADKVGCSKATVWRVLRKYNIV